MGAPTEDVNKAMEPNQSNAPIIASTKAAKTNVQANEAPDALNEAAAASRASCPENIPDVLLAMFSTVVKNTPKEQLIETTRLLGNFMHTMQTNQSGVPAKTSTDEDTDENEPVGRVSTLSDEAISAAASINTSAPVNVKQTTTHVNTAFIESTIPAPTEVIQPINADEPSELNTGTPSIDDDTGSKTGGTSWGDQGASTTNNLVADLKGLTAKYNPILQSVHDRAEDLRSYGLLRCDNRENLEDRVATIMDQVKMNKSKAFKAYLSVGDEKFSHPRIGDILGSSTNKDTISHKVQLLCPRDDFKCFQIDHFVENMQTTILRNKCVGHTDVYAMDITQLSLELLDREASLKQARRYNRDANSVPPFMFRIYIRTGGACDSIQQVAYRAVREINTGLERELRSLHSAIRNKGDIDMLIGMHNHDDAIRLVQMCQATEAYSIVDRLEDPLNRFFAHAPRARNLVASKVLSPSERLEPLEGVTRWANKYHHIVHHMYGSVYDAKEEMEKGQLLPTFTFKASATRLSHVSNDQKFMLRVDPGTHFGYTPKVGDLCKIRASAFKFPARQVTQEQRDGQDTLALRKLLELLTNAPQSEERVAWVLQRAPELTQLGPDAVSSLFQTYTDDDVEDQSAWEDRLVEFISDNASVFQPASQETKEVEVNSNSDDEWLSAVRQDVFFAYQDSNIQLYLVSKPMRKRDANSEPELVDVSIPFVDRSPNESIKSFMERSEREQFDVVISKSVSDKTLRAESHAVNSLIFPRGSDMTISSRSLDAYEYLLAFNSRPDKTANLLQEIPGLERLARFTRDMVDPPPAWLVDEYLPLQKRKKEVMTSCSALPHRVCIINGTAGAGKSKLLKVIILACGYGHCPTNMHPKDAPKPEFSVLYVVNNNEGVDKFSAELVDMFDRLGFGANAPPVLRLYSIDSELASMLKKGKTKPKDPFNQEAAANEMAEFTLADHLMAQYQITKLTQDAFNAARIARERKSKLRNMSLHTHAFAYLEQNRSKYKVLWQLLELALNKTHLTELQSTQFKEHTKNLYQQFLKQFRGIICTTPVAASNHSARASFKPDLVMIDENARMRELSTLILIAWYSPKAWFILGDPRQLRPHLALDIKQSNPYRASLGTSILSRAVEAGEAVCHLNVNYRQYGDLYLLPSQLCYLGGMVSGRNVRYTEAVNKWTAFLQTIHPAQPSNACRLLVEMPGSRTKKSGDSTANPMHARWVSEQVKTILNSDLHGEGKNARHPAKILLLPFYRAQYHQFELELEKIKLSGEFSADQIARVRIITLDSGQGDEEDIVVADLSQTDEPGFCGDWERINLMLTRAVVGQIIMMDRGMWLCSDMNSSIASRASILRSLQLHHEKQGSILTLPCCDRCESIGDHMTSDCRAKARLDGRVERCSKCEKDGHTIETCTKWATCDNCKHRGHTSNECKDAARCYRCSKKDHICYECTTNAFCTTCQSTDHATYKCPERQGPCNLECHNCKQVGHTSASCPEPPVEKLDNRTCRHCGVKGHVKAACPKMTCSRCKQQGHLKYDCTVELCPECRTPKHEGECPSAVECTKCGKWGHDEADCKKDERAKKPRKQDPHSVFMSSGDNREKEHAAFDEHRNNASLLAALEFARRLNVVTDAVTLDDEDEDGIEDYAEDPGDDWGNTKAPSGVVIGDDGFPRLGSLESQVQRQEGTSGEDENGTTQEDNGEWKPVGVGNWD